MFSIEQLEDTDLSDAEADAEGGSQAEPRCDYCGDAEHPRGERCPHRDSSDEGSDGVEDDAFDLD